MKEDRKTNIFMHVVHKDKPAWFMQRRPCVKSEVFAFSDLRTVEASDLISGEQACLCS